MLHDLAGLRLKYPHLFEVLRASGWAEDRYVQFPDGFEDITTAMGFSMGAYHRAFLHSFSGIKVRVPVTQRSGRVYYLGFSVGLGPQLEQMDARDSIAYIHQVAGTRHLFPSIESGSDAVFILEDGRALAIEVSYRTCKWTQDPFQMMNWYAFGTGGPGFVERELTEDERPPIFRW